MTLAKRSAPILVILAALAVVAALVTPTKDAGAADHLDAPGLMSPGSDPRLDINDLYVFEGSNANHTVLAMTVNPVATGDSRFAPDSSGRYQFRIDNNGDAVEDIAYTVSFIDLFFGGQWAVVRKATGSAAENDPGRLVGLGRAGSTINLWDGGKVFTGLRSDPFFFDLGGFLGTVEGIGTRALNDGMESDFFADLNVLAIVLEVPDHKLGGQIGVWATTTSGNRWQQFQLDRMGRPAINTVVNSSGPLVGAPSAAKNVFNGAKPKNDVANFTTAVVTALQIYSSLDTEGPYSNAAAGALAGVLLPDILTYDTATPASGPLNGRALADDVIDIELRIVTGGDPLGLFADRDADGGINTDGVGPHSDYLPTFPYLGNPNS